MAKTETPPTHPKAFGEALRRLRTSTGLSLEDVTSETKISRRLLEALESGSFHILPEKVFSRNFVRQFARTIGCNEDGLAATFDSAWERFQLESGTKPHLVVVDAPIRRSISWRFWFPVVTSALILVVAIAVILTGSAPNNELMPDPRRAIRVAPVESSVAGGGAVIVPATVVAGPGSSADSDVISVTVRVDEGKECWIHYRDHEGMTDQRLLEGGEELRLDLIGPVKFTVGNAGAVTVVVGSMEYRDLGIPGQVIHTEVSSDGLIPLGAGARYD